MFKTILAFIAMTTPAFAFDSYEVAYELESKYNVKARNDYAPSERIKNKINYTYSKGVGFKYQPNNTTTIKTHSMIDKYGKVKIRFRFQKQF